MIGVVHFSSFKSREQFVSAVGYNQSQCKTVSRYSEGYDISEFKKEENGFVTWQFYIPASSGDTSLPVGNRHTQNHSNKKLIKVKQFPSLNYKILQHPMRLQVPSVTSYIISTD